MPHIGDHLADSLVFHPFDALVENDLALIVHHVVEFQDVFTDVEIARLDFLLRLFQRLVDPRVNDRLILLQSQPLQHTVELVGAENAHQIIFERQEEFRMARVALATGTATQLIIDTAAFVTFGAQNVETTGRKRFFFQPRDLRADRGCA